MIYDTNLLIKHIRQNIPLPAALVIPIVIVGELEAFALKADWGYQKIVRLNQLLDAYPIVDIDRELTRVYGQVDAYSQGKLNPINFTSRNMGKNDIWIAATAIYPELELHTADNDFNHLTGIGLKLVSTSL